MYQKSKMNRIMDTHFDCMLAIHRASASLILAAEDMLLLVFFLYHFIAQCGVSNGEQQRIVQLITTYAAL